MNRLRTFLGRRSTTAAIVMLSLVVRLLYLLGIAHQPLRSDAASYAEMASRLAMGSHFIPYWPPALPLYLAVASSLFGCSVLVIRLAMIPFYLGLCFALYRTALYLTSEAACGNLALLPLVFAPGMICASVEPITEMPTAMLLMIVACSLIGVTTGKVYRRAIVLGVAIGCLALLRPASLILLLFVPLCLVWRAKRFLAGLLAGAIPMLMVFAWIVYVQNGTGQLVMINTANARNFYLGNNPETPLYRTWWLGSHHEHEAELTVNQSVSKDRRALDAQYSHLAWDYIRHEPGLFLLRTFNRICVFFALETYAGSYLIENYGFSKLFGLFVVALDSAIYCILAVGSILYLATLPGPKDSSSISIYRSINACILIGLSLLYAAPYFIAFSHPRYHFPIEPLMMVALAAFSLPFIQGAPQAALTMLHGRRFAVATAIVLFLAIQIEFIIIVVRAGLA